MVDNELKLCKFLLNKYASVINEHEKRTIGEIKKLVDGTDLSVQSLTDEFKDEFYEFEKDYKKSLKKAFTYVKKEINFVDTNINLNYWMTAKEVLEEKVCDDEDLAVFTCSIMAALEDLTAEVIVAELDDLKTHSFVTTMIGNKFLLLDPAQKHDFDEFFGKKEEVIEKYTFQDNKIRSLLYKFNSEKYEQFLE